MKKHYLTAILFVSAISFANAQSQGCRKPFISEHLHGQPNTQNQAIEIFNPSDSITVDSSNYEIRIYHGVNTASTYTTIPLSRSIKPRETHVIANKNSDAALQAKADQLDVKLNGNGSEAVALHEKNTNTNIDIIGEIGVNPGNGGWDVPTNGSTKEHDLVRKQPIDRGETDWNVGKNQWDINLPTDISHLKEHINICQRQQNSLPVIYFPSNTLTVAENKDTAFITIRCVGAHSYNINFNEIITYTSLSGGAVCDTPRATVQSDYICEYLYQNIGNKSISFPATSQAVVEKKLPVKIINDLIVEKKKEYVCFWLVDNGVSLYNTTDQNKAYFSLVINDNDYTGVQELINNKQLRVYPNPADDFLIVESKGRNSINSIIIMDIAGRKILSQETGAALVTNINIENIPKGIYFVKLQGDTDSYSVKFTKN